MAELFDRSYLPPAALEGVVVADTHYFPDPGPRPVEFESRRHQSARAERALRLAAALRPDFAIHLGDLAQAVPEGAGHQAAVAAAQEQLRRCALQPHQVAGNQDIGDKPDPTMPTGWVTPATLESFHRRFGRSWYRFTAGDYQVIVLNSQIMNSQLPAAAEQQRWLEAELAALADQPLLLFTHLPLFLRDEHEPDLGHYDNLGQPARAWLIDLIRRHRVALVMTGHSHWAFFNRIGTARFYVAASTSHTRPGFSELFSSAPPPEQGRDDTAKLGFYLLRLQADGPRLHFIRTSGETALPTPADGQLILTRLSRDMLDGRLGVTLTHPLAPTTSVPLAWPSVIRQPVRNDYPLLSLIELGVRAVRCPASDLADSTQRERLDLLQAEGVDLIASWLWSPALDLAAAAAPHRDRLAGVELQLPGLLWPTPAIQSAIERCQQRLGQPVLLSPILPGQPVPGKQLRRTRLGYHPNELIALDQQLAATHRRLDRALARLEPGQPLVLPPLAHIGAVDWVIDAATTEPQAQATTLATALLELAAQPTGRLFVEPLIDLDRTMDVSLGLLDRQCNPRPAFHALRCLNTLLFATADQPPPDAYVLGQPATPPSPAATAAARQGGWIDLTAARRMPPDRPLPNDRLTLTRLLGPYNEGDDR